MTAQPQTGYPEGWQQTPTWSDAEGPSGLAHAFAGYTQGAQPGPGVPAQASPPADSFFAGHDADAPSGLSFAWVPQQTSADPAAQPAYAESGHPAAPQPVYSTAVPQQAYSESGYAAAPQQAYSDSGYAAAPQQAYSESGYMASLQPDHAAPDLGASTYVAGASQAYSDTAYAAASPAGHPGAYPPPQAPYPPAAAAVSGPAPQAVPGYLQPYGPSAAGSGRGPGVGAVVAATLFLGPFGAIWAAKRADRARAVGDSSGKYWLAFGGTLVGGWVVGAVSLILVLAMSGLVAGSSAGDSGSATTTAVELQQSIVQQGTFPDANGKKLRVKSATCQAAQLLGGSANGAGTYKCTLGLVGGTKDTVLVSLDANGRWKVTGQAK